MEGIIYAIISITVIGIVCAIVLTVASKVMGVKEDERFPAVRKALPGANCGACAYAGCDGYARALIAGEGIKTNLCVPGGDGVARELAELLGVEFEDVIEQAAVINCKGDCTATSEKMDYQGIKSCKAAKPLFGGPGMCSFGCMGLGDCAAVCPNDAIYMENGIARIYTRLCIGCGMCALACPNELITMVSCVERAQVTCSSTEKGALTRKKCTHGCIACKKCEKECPVGAVTIIDNLARIDYDKCTNCGRCAEICPAQCITECNFSEISSMAQ